MLVNRYVYSIADSMFIPLPVYEYRCGSVRPLDTAGWVLKNSLARGKPCEMPFADYNWPVLCRDVPPPPVYL